MTTPDTDTPLTAAERREVELFLRRTAAAFGSHELGARMRALAEEFAEPDPAEAAARQGLTKSAAVLGGER